MLPSLYRFTSFGLGHYDNDSGSYRVRLAASTGVLVDATPEVLAPVSRGQAIAVAPGPSLAVFADDGINDEAAADTFIAGTRIDASGASLDGSGFLVSASANTEISPSVSFDGTNFFVVWTDNRDYDTPATPPYFTDIWARG